MRVAMILALCASALIADATAQTMRVGPFELGMSPSEVERAVPGSLRLEAPTRSGTTLASGAANLFGADFTVSAVFYWNTGLRSLSILHVGDEDDASCRALAQASAAAVQSGLGLDTPSVPQERDPWYVGKNNYDQADAVWDMNWYAGGDVTPVSHPAGTGVRSSSNAPNGRPSRSSFLVHRAA